jgi:murein L,D-transpeptidase YcbB/YkuD
VIRARTWTAAVALALALTVFGLSPAARADLTGPLKERIDLVAKAAREADDKARIEAVRAFYAKRDFRPIWFEDSGAAARTKALLEQLAAAGEHGLKPASYGLPALGQAVAKADAKAMPELELRLTLTLVEFAGDIASGRLQNPRRAGSQTFFREAKRPDTGKLLADLVASDNLAKFFVELPPDNLRYRALKAALAEYRALAAKGGWPTVAPGPTLKIGMRDPRVDQVRRRLAVTGELRDTPTDPLLFDGPLLIAVKKFQERHGLKDDGNVGAGTVAEMNVPVAERVDQIIINMERRRWLAPQLGDRYIYVNVADNDLKVIEGGRTVYTARVVVGRPYHETPAFSATMTYIEMNPWWNVPHSIATKEMLPIIKRAPGYLEANDYLLLTRMGDNNSAIAPSSVDWSRITPENFPFFIRQKPGPRNALGTILFMFPNGHNVFIHDTPLRQIFNLDDRFFSHGCVRVEHPLKLATLLLKEHPEWSEARILDAIGKKDPLRVNLKNPLPVHITYLTAWVERDGSVQFRKDAYRRDGSLKRALEVAQATR